MLHIMIHYRFWRPVDSYTDVIYPLFIKGASLNKKVNDYLSIMIRLEKDKLHL